jgi:hypothetical protein
MPTLTASVDLLPVMGNIPAARHLTVELMRAWGVPQETEDAALLLVQAIADRWGSEEHAGGKRVWFELAPPSRCGSAGLPPSGRGEDSAMSEPNSTEPAGTGLSDEEMVETVAGQTDSASENADAAGKNWNGDPSSAPAPDDRG